MENNEIWSPIIIGAKKTRFDISSLGRIRCTFKNRVSYKILTPDKRDGYCRVHFVNEWVRTNCKVHRLVAQSFIPNPLNLPEVNHKDLDKSNNHVDNLEWASKSDNSKHATDNGVIKIFGGYEITQKAKPLASFMSGEKIKEYRAVNQVKKDGFPIVSVQRALKSGKEYRGFEWKYLHNAI